MYEKDFNEDFKCLFDVTFFGFLLVSLVQIVAIVFRNESEIMVINRNILMPKNVFPNILYWHFAKHLLENHFVIYRMFYFQCVDAYYTWPSESHRFCL